MCHPEDPINQARQIPLHRLSEQRGGEWHPFRGNGHYSAELDDGRLVVSPNVAPLHLLLKLASEAGSEFYVLWILHTPRGGSRAGRYQSPLLPLVDVKGLLARFGEFLEHDGRHDLWLHAPESGATLVWDRHEQIFLYGPLERFEAVLDHEGLAPGELGVPVPHAHNYHAEYDEAERTMAQAVEWRIDELREEDEQ